MCSCAISFLFACACPLSRSSPLASSVWNESTAPPILRNAFTTQVELRQPGLAGSGHVVASGSVKYLKSKATELRSLPDGLDAATLAMDWLAARKVASLG